ncbi:MarR family transcriptional regulator [Lampropedia puyangensis]|uniref:MarR family transcriptional regulator n=1 Tax=Lampropedia puyangensis TaxID=1330072 RepID=A0A4S8F2L8_9BURK|nr:MarR family transcriptional regulator [Lampropedia puyangensis]THU00645.1 MarR family transcriptional regulator [Lampropedia puyangensis]
MKLEQKYEALLGEMLEKKSQGIHQIRACFQLLSLASSIDRDCATRLAPHGLSEGRFVMLFLLNAAFPNGLAPNVLAEKAGISRATVTSLLDGLEQLQLVTRHADPNDRRALQIHLTNEGQDVAKTVTDQHAEWIAGLLKPLSATELELLSSLLAKVAAPLNNKIA